MAGGTIEDKFRANVHWIVWIATIVLSIAGSWYGGEVRAAVQEERQTQLERRVQTVEEAVKKYPDLMIEVSVRLSRIEGALGVRPMSISTSTNH